jgi:mannose-6-phosphate isomerase-like protein (cupin superfamily)
MMKKIVYSVCLLNLLVFLSSCAATSRQVKIVSPEVTFESIKWTPEELAKDFSIRTLRTTGKASYHIIRLRGMEKMHVHDTHDATIFVLSGKADFFLKDRTVTLNPGDVVEIPHGVVHQAINRDPVATEAYAVFTPSYDGTDMRPVDVKTGNG